MLLFKVRNLKEKTWESGIESKWVELGKDKTEKVGKYLRKS